MENKINLGPVFKKYLQRLYNSSFLQQRRFITFLFFLVLSATFWFIRSLSEQYEANIEYPVRYINFPENKILVGYVPYKLNLTVQAKGFSILKSKLNPDLVPLRFNVNSFSLNSVGPDTFYIITESIKEVLSAELENMTILKISPDTLFFHFTGVSVKKIPVKANLALHDKFFQQEFMLNGNVITNPDSVIVSGPGTIVDKIKEVNTKPIQFSNLSDTAIINFSLAPIDMITFSQQSVKVMIPVDRFTEVEKPLPVTPVNVPDSLNMIPVPGQVVVTYRICLSNYNRIVNNPISPKIDFTDIKEKKQSRLTVFLSDTPSYISNISINPKVIEFLITRR